MHTKPHTKESKAKIIARINAWKKTPEYTMFIEKQRARGKNSPTKFSKGHQPLTDGKNLKGLQAGKTHWNWKGGKPKCKDCESTISHKATFCKRCCVKGERSTHWRGGITPKNKLIRESIEYKLWRKSVFERDGYACVWCGDDKSGNLNADHIKPFSEYPELRLAIDNGRTLCVPCHKTTSSYLKRTKNK